jgi:4a-hydroxytetrahydrobiopterin dehydratase
MELQKEKCVSCQGGMPTITNAEIDLYYQKVQRWSVVEKGGIKRLEKSFKFKDFAQVLEFLNRVGELGEREGHYPDILAE